MDEKNQKSAFVDRQSLIKVADLISIFVASLKTASSKK